MLPLGRSPSVSAYNLLSQFVQVIVVSCLSFPTQLAKESSYFLLSCLKISICKYPTPPPPREDTSLILSVVLNSSSSAGMFQCWHRFALILCQASCPLPRVLQSAGHFASHFQKQYYPKLRQNQTKACKQTTKPIWIFFLLEENHRI